MRGLLVKLVSHTSMGAFIGYALLHPIALLIYSRTFPDSSAPSVSIFAAFDMHHVWMALYFALLGGAFGLVHGFDKYRTEKLFERVEQLSITDALTGLFNRRYLMENLQKECQRAKRYGNDLSLMMIDIDYFKQYNDTNGHVAGDNLLQKFAGRLQNIARRTDFVARYGGEEFTIVMPDTHLSMAAKVAERLRSDIEEHPFANRDTQPGGKITVSIGCALLDSHTDENAAVALLQKADKCLYEAKKSGRNRICCI